MVLSNMQMLQFNALCGVWCGQLLSIQTENAHHAGYLKKVHLVHYSNNTYFEISTFGHRVYDLVHYSNNTYFELSLRVCDS